MRLYIPTCTLNFNNILSSESISPLGFYARRGFGNKRFYPVCANDKEQVIISYSKYPRFEVEENGLENYPMIIEIETDDYKDGFFEKAKEHDGVETYLCYHTINLNPFHCRIYLNSYQERQGVLSKAEQSLENKFYKLYAPNIGVKPKERKTFFGVAKDLFTQSEKDDFLWNPSYANCKIKNKSIDVSRDVLLDRIKGFIYCYIIGANSSVSNEVGKLKALSRKLRNTLSAVINSPDKRPTQAQDNAILSGIREFNEIYSSIDEDTIWNKNLLELKLSDNPQGLSAKDAKDLLHYWGIYDAFCNKLHLRRVYDANDLWSCLEYASPETFARVTDAMNSAVRKLEAKNNAQREKYAIKALLNIDDDLSLHILDTSYQSSFYRKLICSQFMAEYKSVMEENGVEEPLAQAYNGGIILRNMLGDKWDSNPASAYVGALLNHFQENSAFDLFAIENDVLSSFAAFCQKGDNIDRLAEYLVQIGFCNYKLAYGIYGATRGFTSLPKTFTSVLINGNKDYYQSFASDVWRMLNGVEIKNAVLPKASTNTSVIVESQLESKIIKNINSVEPKVVKQQKDVEAVNKTVEFENAVQSPKAFMYIFGSFSRITTTKAYKALDAVKFAGDEDSYTPEQFRSKIYSIVGKEGLKTQKENIDKAIALEGKRQDPEAFLSILDNFLKPTDAAYKKIVKLISDFASSNTTSHSQSVGNIVVLQSGIGERNLKPINPTSSKFVEDKNVSHFILSRNYLPEKMRDRLSKKVIAFQKGYALGGKYYSNPLDNPIDNRSTIDHFKHWCFYDKGSYPPIVEGTYENKQYFEQLMQDLFNRYANR
ncbi:hypothetical protein K0G09_12940 [Bacteroides fragilis]|nr:hypothetical protein [Bacteroides fragilis]